MHTRRSQASSAAFRRGLLTLELVVTLPVLTILLLGLIEFACLWQGYCEITDAGQVGAVEAARPGVMATDVDRTVRRALSERLSAVAEVTCRPALPDAEEPACRIRVPMSACAPNLLWPVGFDLEDRYLVCAVPSATR